MLSRLLPSFLLAVFLCVLRSSATAAGGQCAGGLLPIGPSGGCGADLPDSHAGTVESAETGFSPVIPNAEELRDRSWKDCVRQNCGECTGGSASLSEPRFKMQPPQDEAGAKLYEYLDRLNSRDRDDKVEAEACSHPPPSLPMPAHGVPASPLCCVGVVESLGSSARWETERLRLPGPLGQGAATRRSSGMGCRPRACRGFPADVRFFSFFCSVPSSVSVCLADSVIVASLLFLGFPETIGSGWGRGGVQRRAGCASSKDSLPTSRARWLKRSQPGRNLIFRRFQTRERSR